MFPRVFASALIAAALLPGIAWVAVASARSGAWGLSADEISAIVRHGPWPVSWKRDASNRVSGSAAAIAFGQQLFFDPRLSGTGKVSCATCHVPEKSWADARKLGAGLEEVDRNTPSLLNVRYQRWFGWDGANDSLWSQSVRPMLEAKEMAATDRHVGQLVRTDAEFSCRYRMVFGSPPPADNETLLVDIGKALAAFQETLISGRSAFDDFRDALAKSDWKAAANYPESARRGAQIFVGKGNCSLCHFGPAFTHGEFHEAGIPIARKSGGIDWGRYQGIKMLRASRFNLLGLYNDDKTGTTATSTRFVHLAPQTFEQFRVPGLRNVARTAPYMHNGHFNTLRDVVKHYSDVDTGLLHQAHIYAGDVFAEAAPVDNMLRPLRLLDQEISDLLAFMESLSERKAAVVRKPVMPCK